MVKVRWHVLVLLQELLAKGNQWTKEMEMRLTDTDVVLLDGETQVRIYIQLYMIVLVFNPLKRHWSNKNQNWQ